LNPHPDKPLVSVILPTHDRAALVGRAISSVLGQTYENLELIVIDDASTDHTRDVLAGFKDSRLRVLHAEVNKGVAAARNLGLMAARGDLIAFNDDDDVWFARKLERQTEALARAPAGVDWCLCGFVRRAGGRSEYIGGSWYYAQLDFNQGANRFSDGGMDWSLIATPTWVVKREALERAGPFDERLRSWEDWELALRLEQTCKRIFVDEPLFLQDLTEGGGLGHAEQAQAQSLRVILDKHGAMWSARREVMARHYFIIGHVASKYDGPGAGREYLLRSLRLRPFMARTWTALALSLAGERGRRVARYLQRARSLVHHARTRWRTSGTKS
jgi:glycosyltransferase involved in cell wall biosynthesis